MAGALIKSRTRLEKKEAVKILITAPAIYNYQFNPS